MIRSGTVIDGTGAPRFAADVAIRDGRISGIGAIPEPARRTLDATGLWVTPGFIDAHTHLDAQIFRDPDCDPVTLHGVTTVVIGNCGLSLAPCTEGSFDPLCDVFSAVEDAPARALVGSEWRGGPFGAFLRAVEDTPKSVNVATLVGHVAIRMASMGLVRAVEPIAPTASERQAMAELVEEALSAGAFGVSTSRHLNHRMADGRVLPGTWADRDELAALSAPLDGGRGVLQSVPRSAYCDIGKAGLPHTHAELDWMKAIAQLRSCRIVFSVFTEQLVPDRHRLLLKAAASARRKGINLHPMVPARIGTVLSGLYGMPPVDTPAWRDLYERPAERRLTAIGEGPWQRRLAELPADVARRASGTLSVLGEGVGGYARTEERRLGNIARRRNQSVGETLVALLLESRGEAIFCHSRNNQDEEHVEECLRAPGTLPGLGDAGAHVGSVCDASWTSHFLASVSRDRGLVSPENAIARLTREPAEAFGLSGVGELRVGARADLNVLDWEGLDVGPPRLVRDLPGRGARWRQDGRGFVCTVVGGEIVADKGTATGARPGRLLRRGSATGGAS